MIKITQIKIIPQKDQTEADRKKLLQKKAGRCLHIDDNKIKEIRILKKSIDARKKDDVLLVYSILVDVENEQKILDKNRDKNNSFFQECIPQMIKHGKQKLDNRPIVVGSGPAGMFCAYFLAKEGYCPIILERGEEASKRKNTVEKFWDQGKLSLNSNVQFGEGGAGTFSDGKLNTQIKDPSGRIQRVLQTFVQFGASEEILYDQKPHIGTDHLIQIVEKMRNEIICLGGEVHFQSKVSELILKNKRVEGVKTTDGRTFLSEVIILAIGHSARDTFIMLKKNGIPMEAKEFAIGLRVQHLQKDINLSQYGEKFAGYFGAAPYKLTAKSSKNRGIYSFCMCPGGYVVNASSEEGRMAVNGMSYSDRNSNNANSAIIVSVGKDDFQEELLKAGIKTDESDCLNGMYFQQLLEEKAFSEGQGSIPVQKYGDFKENKCSTTFGTILPEIKGKYCFGNLRNVLPTSISDSFVEGMEKFEYNLKGFAEDDVLLAGIESRTSSPVRILRNGDLESAIGGLYPAGEGAGYAGGITSAAVDGIKIAEKIIQKYKEGKTVS